MTLESTPPESSTPDRNVGDHAPAHGAAQRLQHTVAPVLARQLPVAGLRS